MIEQEVLQKVWELVQMKLAPSTVFVIVFLVCIILILMIQRLTNKKMLRSVKFSQRHYYVVMAWVPISFLLIGLFFDVRYLLFFLISGFAGIIGETILSIVWDILLDKPIWSYHAESAVNGYTSKLNFLPWTTGAFIFLSVGRIIGRPKLNPVIDTKLSYYSVIIIFLMIGLLITIILEVILEIKNSKDNKTLDLKFNIYRFFVFCIPIFSIYLGLILFCSWQYILFAFFFAIVGNLTEYMYGKYIEIVFGRRLWTYNYLKIEKGHSSLTNLPLWAFGGLYFYMIADYIGLMN